jgi:2-polyprenyl-3-methyl-5-hydroxy-6-metoxy-1,4-benzoquinol methylase
MNITQYPLWVEKRFTSVEKEISKIFNQPDYFSGKTVLELGALYGYFGEKFHNSGALVTCYEGREENLKVLKKNYPHLDSHLVDCDKLKLNKKYDIILHAGLLYHLKNVKESLVECLNSCEVFILETENINSDKNEVIFEIENASSTCNLSSIENSDATNIVSKTSRKYLETIFQENNFNYKLINDEDLNYHAYVYNWEVGDEITSYGLRSVYIAWKKH